MPEPPRSLLQGFSPTFLHCGLPRSACVRIEVSPIRNHGPESPTTPNEHLSPLIATARSPAFVRVSRWKEMRSVRRALRHDDEGDLLGIREHEFRAVVEIEPGLIWFGQPEPPMTGDPSASTEALAVKTTVPSRQRFIDVRRFGSVEQRSRRPL